MNDSTNNNSSQKGPSKYYYDYFSDRGRVCVTEKPREFIFIPDVAETQECEITTSRFIYSWDKKLQLFS